MLTIFYIKDINNTYSYKIKYWFNANKSLALHEYMHQYILTIDKFKKYNVHEYVQNNKPNVIFYK